MRKNSFPLLFLGFLCLLLPACDRGGSAGNPPAPAGDPLAAYQWHLRNTGQKTFSQSAGEAGSDLNIGKTMADGITGAGVIVAVVDTGLEIGHEDLVNNVIPGGSYNFVGKTTDPSPPAIGKDGEYGDHGTSVAGIIAAEANNGKGGSGVASKASLKGFNYLATDAPADEVTSLGGSDRSKDVHVFNMSYGATVNMFIPLSKTEDELWESTKTLRGGKGGIYVKSSGNGYEDVRQEDKSWYACRRDAAYPDAVKALDVTCENATGNELCGRPELIVIGAYNASGVKSSYSTAGSVLWVSAPGGEYGSASPAILTTDQSGCDKGYSRRRDLYSVSRPAANDFEMGEAENDGKYNPGCNYTSTFNGTSSAAPNASGAVALILQANPNLKRREVKHILARTARPIDSGIAAQTLTIAGKPYTAEQGWITNKANPAYRFHNWYGFGAIDVDAAVTMAKTYQPGTLGEPQQKVYGGDLAHPLAVPDENADGATARITIPDNLTIEHLSVGVAIDHPNTGELGIELTSPGGTKSILLNIRSAVKTGLYHFDNGTIIPAPLASNAFYGEKAAGEWTLRIVDGVAGNTGALKYFALGILGY